MRWLTLTVTVLLMNGSALSEELINITVFKLANGDSIQAYRFIASGDGDHKQYDVTLIDGSQRVLRESDIASRQTTQIGEENLAPVLRRNRKAVPAMPAANAAGSETRTRFGDALHKARDAEDVYKKAANELNDARHALLLASRELDDMDTAIGAQDAKIEGLLSQVFVRVGTDTRRLDLERARAEQLRLQQARRPIDEKVGTLKQQVADLEAKAGSAKSAVEATLKAVDTTRGDLIREQQKDSPAVKAPEKAAPVNDKVAVPGLAKRKTMTVFLNDGTHIDAVSATDSADGKSSLIKDTDNVVHHIAKDSILRTEKIPLDE